MIPYTLLNLLHQRKRTTIALAGVAFSNILIFMQLGFYASAESTATLLLRKLDFDLVVLSPDYFDINRPGLFPRARMQRLAAFPEVQQMSHLYISSHFWRIVHTDKTQEGLRRNMGIIAFDPDQAPFLLPDLREKVAKLKIVGNAIVDTKSRTYFGDLSAGVESELGMARVRIVDNFTIGTGFGSDGMVMCSSETFSRIFGRAPLDKISLGLVKLRPEADPSMVAAQIRASFPGGNYEPMRIFTRQELEDQEMRFWVTKTSVGQIFFLGVLVAMFVGIVFVYQVISSDLKNRMSEFATLKAMGYGDRFLDQVVLEQALWYAALGFLPALVISLVLYRWIAEIAVIPLEMTVERFVLVLVSGILMCILSGWMALRRVKSADPAELF
ncbi:MAG: FtsX-like permease family protein [Gemmataceae bacterium]